MSQGDSFHWSQPAERNQQPILERLAPLLTCDQSWHVLEIGSCTGQHAVHFATQMPHVVWQTSDLIDHHASINAYLDTVSLENVRRPLELDAASLADVELPVDMIYTANTLHIMSWENVERLFSNAGQVLTPGSLLVVYGPFHVGGQATSDGNYRFDLTLSQTNAWQGIRHREAVVRCADSAGFSMTERYDMPANNQLLVFSRRRT